MSKYARTYNIGPYSIILPPGHMLDEYQAGWRRYDVALGEIARIIHARYPGFTAIDIGANIGDSAALICKYNPVPVLCVEGTPGFLALLATNTARISSKIRIEACFLGADGHTVKTAQILEKRGTASLAGESWSGVSGMDVPMKSLGTVLAEHPEFASPRLIKIDTDGLDFRILIASRDCLERTRPVLFFEYDPSYPGTSDDEALQAIETLISIGYSYFIVYDNFGNYLMTATTPEIFIGLNAYLRSNKKYGCAVYYFDICALTDDDADLFEQITAFELSV